MYNAALEEKQNLTTSNSKPVLGSGLPQGSPADIPTEDINLLFAGVLLPPRDIAAIRSRQLHSRL
jgi:hypothetical protein